MSKSISGALKSHLAAGATTIATCWKITRADGEEFFFTDHDVNISYAGDTYEASAGMMASAHEQSRGGGPDNMETMAFLESPRITESDLRAGKYDGATLDVFIINYKSPGQGVVYLAQGWALGQVSISDQVARVEVRGKTDRLRRFIGPRFSKTCRATFGDSACGYGLSAVSQAASVSTVTDRRVFRVTGASITDGDDYVGGKVVFDSDAANPDFEMDIAACNAATDEITLLLPAPTDIGPSDGLTIIEGCPKTTTACDIRFGNLDNFRGEPFIPGENAFHAPDRKDWTPWER